MNIDRKEAVAFFKGLAISTVVSLLLWVLILGSCFLLSGCAAWKEYYGEDWWQGWNCAARWGTDACQAMNADGWQNH